MQGLFLSKKITRNCFNINKNYDRQKFDKFTSCFKNIPCRKKVISYYLIGGRVDDKMNEVIRNILTILYIDDSKKREND